MEKYNIEKVWITDDAVWIRTADGKEASEKFADYQRLRFATPEQRAQFTYDEYGIRWDEVDEDLSFHAFFRDRKANPLYDLFIAHPELNASAIARRLGMSQSLFVQYISGSKRPSPMRYEEILQTIRAIGQELMAV